MALGRSARPTNSTTNAWPVGRPRQFVSPSSSARTYTCQSWTVPVAISAQRSRAWTMAAERVQSKTRRLGQRSARTPPTSEKSSTGRDCSAPTRPSWKALWVNSSTSQACPMLCM